MRIANNVEMLELTGTSGKLHPILIWDENQLVLIDTGLPGQLGDIKLAVEKTGHTIEQITKVILTHQDVDHTGNAKLIAELGAEIMAHSEEAPYIDGSKTPVKIEDLEKRADVLTEGEREFLSRIKPGFGQSAVSVDKLLSDGETLDFCGGIEVVYTPGHTPGHISLLLKESGIIVAGDAANIYDGSLSGADPVYTHDMTLAGKSFDRIKALEPNKIVCYHGGCTAGFR